MAVQDIIVSPASIWYAPVGTAVPDETTVAVGASWGGSWTNLGYTLEPIQVSLETETFSLTVEQLTIPVRQIRTAMNISFSTVLAELTGTNLALVTDGTKVTMAAGVGQKGFDEITVDAGKTDVSLYAFGIEGVRVTNTNVRVPVRVFIPRGSIVSDGDITFAKGAGVGVPVKITALADVSNGTGLVIHNVTAPAT